MSDKEKKHHIFKFDKPMPKIDRPIVKVIPMDLSDHEASDRLIKRSLKRIYEAHKEAIDRLAYK
ncbi:hypothetical protein [Basilea psittacipulmonis]|uniref:Uncharacterized protein n=1 Tax=Basilea psittacipulmonis DSM 24701 TaxID=1072685 RepID=A0A077DHZ1_9BURK|nr:hypothetical protein [Basilea psittacipulmonis]AIL33152.1 hypothetical protein IX83_07460 [Basilea psittacipulmonis DSM 24701]